MACGISQTYGGVKRCMLRGKAPSPEPQTEPRRYDWLAEFPCDHRGTVTDELGCGCASQTIIKVRECLETTEARCVPISAHRALLLRKHAETARALRICEDCPLRTHSG